jgi:tetratricopeptide (TPR) repeat protein
MAAPQTDSPASAWSGRDLTAGLAAFLTALTGYLLTLPPSITLEDAGELAVAADFLGVPHPPGYPIWTFLTWLISRPFRFLTFRGYPNPAWGITFASALYGALACGILAALLCRCGRDTAERLPNGPGSLIPRLPALSVGLGGGLITALSLHTFPLLGNALLFTAVTGGLILPLLRGLTSPESLRTWQQKLPHPADTGACLTAFLTAATVYYLAWNLLRIPSPLRVFPLALGLLSALAALMFLGDRLAQHIARAPRPDLTRAPIDILCGTAGGILLAFSPLMWSQSVIIEVYSLNALFIALILALVYDYIHTPRDRTLYATTFLFALGLTNHQALAFLLFFLIAGLAAARRRRLLRDALTVLSALLAGFLFFKARQYAATDPQAERFFLQLLLVPAGCVILLLPLPGRPFRSLRQLTAMLLLGLLGLGFHAFMPLASMQNPPMNWGNTQTLTGFLRVVTRGQYERFDTADNLRAILADHQTPLSPELLDPARAEELNAHHRRRTFFMRQLGAYFWNPASKFSIASQFSWQFPREPAEPGAPPSPDRTLPVALIAFIPFLLLSRMDARQRAWLHATAIAFFFVTVVFLIIQNPALDTNDLWVKRVQYVQAHVFFAFFMGLGAFLLLLGLHSLLPRRGVLIGGGVCVLALFTAMPLHKDARDPAHREFAGASSQRGRNFGWRFGNHLVRGIHGILLDELAHHPDPPYQLTDWALDYLRTRGLDSGRLEALQSLNLPSGTRRELKRHLSGFSPDEQRLILDAALLGPFLALSREEQSASLRWLHTLPPDLSYPPELDPDAILFGGTDPGRFVPTYLFHSARLRPDLFILTQNALADSTYLETLRLQYGGRIFTPTDDDNHRAFRSFADHVRIFDPDAFAALMQGGDVLEVTGVAQVNHINFQLTERIIDENIPRHSIYLEESFTIPALVPRLRPHGLIFKVGAEPVDLTPAEIRRDMDFWDWYIDTLLETHLPPAQRSRRFQSDAMARRTFSKLRTSQAGLYHDLGFHRHAERAFRQAQRLYPANPETAFRFAELPLSLQRFDDAEDIINTFAPFDPHHAQIPVFHRQVAQLRDLDRRRLAAEQAWDSGPGVNLALQLTQFYGLLGMTEPMEDIARVLLNLPRIREEFYPPLAEFLRTQEHRELYQQTLEVWTERYPDSIDPILHLAAIALSDRDIPRFYERLDRALALDPGAVRTRLRTDPRFLDIHHWTGFQQRVR